MMADQIVVWANHMLSQNAPAVMGSVFQIGRGNFLATPHVHRLAAQMRTGGPDQRFGRTVFFSKCHPLFSRILLSLAGPTSSIGQVNPHR